ncbi:DUF6626 family protein [Magnetospirillum sp. SS-4]|uniref:DUF6626 family protein n=1 Tax=Magnetospirillum sp. SS-4 TaxID=2681465 RepID=UPI001382393E|nr:DUF6626 family protein [Magnetospirillum sp. SS-4]CAA7626915.1 conserved hypothetical protein [Magnetospirillum sp. SS-4]
MILIEARDTLMDLGLTHSQLDFSARWLGKQPSCVVARGQEPSAEALLALAGRVTREAMQMRRVFRHAEASALDALSAKVWSELLARYAGQPETA